MELLWISEGDVIGLGGGSVWIYGLCISCWWVLWNPKSLVVLDRFGFASCNQLLKGVVNTQINDLGWFRNRGLGDSRWVSWVFCRCGSRWSVGFVVDVGHGGRLGFFALLIIVGVWSITMVDDGLICQLLVGFILWDLWDFWVPRFFVFLGSWFVL